MKINSLIRVRFIDRDGDEFTIEGILKDCQKDELTILTSHNKFLFTILMEEITLIKLLDDK